MQNGTLTVSFDYRESLAETANAEITFLSDSNRREYAVLGEINALGEANILDFGAFGSPNIDFEAYINRQRLAAGLNFLGNDFYGITFSTFRNDLRKASQRLALDNSTINLIADYVESIEGAMNSDTVGLQDLLEPYADILISHINNAELSTERISITVGGQDVRVTKLDLYFTEQDVLALIWKIYELLENDHNIRVRGSYILDGILEDLSRSINELEQELTGDFSLILSFYMGGRNRLMRFDAKILERGHTEVEINAEFGASADDTWNVTVFSPAMGTFSFEWVFEEVNNRYRHTTIAREVAMGNQRELGRIISDWNPSSGALILTMENEWDNRSVRGNLTTTGDSFEIGFSDIPFGSYDSLNISITASHGANIENISFTNIDQWDRTWIDAWRNAFID
jgi:hypothetical protein